MLKPTGPQPHVGVKLRRCWSDVGCPPGGGLATTFLTGLTTRGLRGAGFLKPLTRRRLLLLLLFLGQLTTQLIRILLRHARQRGSNSASCAEPWRGGVFKSSNLVHSTTDSENRPAHEIQTTTRKFHAAQCQGDSHQKLTKTLRLGCLGVTSIIL